MLQRFILFLLSAYFGLSLYFSFVIAPTLFRVLDKKQAGLIVSKIFPSYFWIGLIIFIISLIYFIKNSYGFAIYTLIVIVLILLIIQIFYILPSSALLKETNYDGFLKLHLWSVIFNIVVILVNGVTIMYFIYKH